MPRFFRDLRRKLISGNTRKYLVYAIGEILLVVVGILIALQVNNWNEERKERQLEINVLKEISSDLHDDVLSLENDIRLNRLYIQTIEIIKTALKEQTTYSDSLADHFGKLTFNTTYTLKTGGYANLQNRGFEIIENDTVRKHITYLYDSSYSFLKESQTTADRLTYDLFTPAYITYFKTIDSKLRENEPGRIIMYTPSDYQKLRMDEEFKRLLDFLNQVKIENLYAIDLTFIRLRETIKVVDEYLLKLDG